MRTTARGRFPNADARACAAADAYIGAATALADQSQAAVKLFTAINLFLWHLDAFARDEDPIPAFVKVFDDAAQLLQSAGASNVCGNHFPAADDFETSEEAIGGLFGDVYGDYTDEIYFDETYRVLHDRLTTNAIVPEELFGDRVVLEAGCGGGKVAAAIARIGARRVIGVDIGEDAIKFARQQAEKTPHGGLLDYRVGSVLDLPLDDESVDIVWSNSVIHLTDDWDGCFVEAARVLKPGGLFYVYVDGDFGLFDVLVWTLRQVAHQIPPKLFHEYLVQLGVNPGRISWIIPTLYLPYAGKPRREVEAMMRRAGFIDLRRLTRGIAIDQIEQVSAGLPYADVKYGEAQLKYLARKPN